MGNFTAEQIADSLVRPRAGPEPAPEWLDDMKVLSLQDGDIVVMRSPQRLSMEAGERIRAQVTAVIEEMVASRGIRFKVMILEDGMDIGVIRGESSGYPHNRDHDVCPRDSTDKTSWDSDGRLWCYDCCEHIVGVPRA